MNLPAALFAIRWLIRDTFRQALASGIFWLMLAVSAICAAVCLTVAVAGDVPFARDPGSLPEMLPPEEIEKAALGLFAANSLTVPAAPHAWRLPVPLEHYRQNRLAVARKDGVDLIQGQV